MISKPKKIILIIFIIFFFTSTLIVGTIIIKKAIYRYNNYTEYIKLYEKEALIFKKQVLGDDYQIIAFASGSTDSQIYRLPQDRIYIDIIQGANIISDDDLQVLFDSINYQKSLKPVDVITRFINYYVIYFVEKGNEDYIYLYNPFFPSEKFLFKSNLNYSFKSIVDDFKAQYNINLSNDFLNSSIYDENGRLTSGIMIKTILVGSNDGIEQYNLSYIVKYEGKIYSINK